MEDEFKLWRSLDEITVTQAAYLMCNLSPPETPPIIYIERPETYHIKPEIAYMMLGKLNKAIDEGILKLSRFTTGFKKMGTTDDGKEIYATPRRYVTINSLKEYVLLTGERPAFLFPTNDKVARSEEGLQIEKSDISEQKKIKQCKEVNEETELDNIIRNLNVFFENNYEVKIQRPGERKRVFTNEQLGFDRIDTKGWTTLIKVIEGPDHCYRLGRSGTKLYDSKMKIFREINKKLIVNLLEKFYQLQVPVNFKIYERVPEEGQGVYKFKFMVGKEGKQKKYDVESKEKYLAELESLYRQFKKAYNEGSDYKAERLKNRIKEEVTNALMACLVEEQDIKDIIQDMDIFSLMKIDKDQRYINDPDIESIR